MEIDILKELKELKKINLLQAKQILTISETALFSGLTKKYIYKLCSTHKIPYYKSDGGKYTYIKKQDIEDWMTKTKINS